MKGLTKDKQQALVEIVTEEAGAFLNRNNFNEHLLLLLEDIAGFETMSKRESTHTLNQLWRRYHDLCN